MTLPTLFIAHPFCRPLPEITHDVALRGATKGVGSKSRYVGHEMIGFFVVQ
jgi:hypothetical protein